MGNFYTNILLKGALRGAATAAVKQMRRSAYVSPTQRRVTVVYDAKCETQDTKILCDVSLALSRALRCVAWGVLNHDDDVLWYVLCSRGAYADSYNSAPDYFDDGNEAPAAPKGGNPQVLA